MVNKVQRKGLIFGEKGLKKTEKIDSVKQHH